MKLKLTISVGEIKETYELEGSLGDLFAVVYFVKSSDAAKKEVLEGLKNDSKPVSQVPGHTSNH